MNLSRIGQVAFGCWVEIPSHFPAAMVDEMILMPNHVHGIVMIRESVETPHVAPLQQPRIFGPLQPGSLSKIIQAYKSAVTRWAHMNGYPHFTWQPRFYDHMIPDERSLRNIRRYIRDNPLRWDQDHENPEGLHQVIA